MKKNEAFTLIELMIVVAIIAILSTGVIMKVRQRMKNNEILKIRSNIPKILDDVGLRLYEQGTTDAAISISVNSDGNSEFKVTGGSVGEALKSQDKTIEASYYKLILKVSDDKGTTWTESNSLSYSQYGAFEKFFKIGIIDKADSTNTPVYEIYGKTMPELGISAVEVVKN